MKFSVSAVLPIPARQFLMERDSTAFRTLVAKTLKLGMLDIEDAWMEGDVEVCKFVTNPELDKYVPRQFQKYIPLGKLVYTDIIQYRPENLQASPYTLVVESIPPVFAKRATIECKLIIEKVDDARCRQTLAGNVEIRIPMLGKIAESIIVDSLDKVYKSIPQVVEKWNAFRAEVLAQPGGQDVLLQGRPDTATVGWIREETRARLAAPYAPSESAANVIAEAAAAELADVDRGGQDEGGLPTGTRAAAAEAVDGLAAEGMPEDSLMVEGRGVMAGHVERALESTLLRSASGEMYYDAVDFFIDTEALDAYDAAVLRTDREAALAWYQRHLAEHGGDVQPLYLDGTSLHDSETASRDGTPERSREPSRSDSAAEAAGARPGLKTPSNGKQWSGLRVRERFTNAYAKEWSKFWEEMRVPVADVPSIPARLGHLFGLASAWGFIRASVKGGNGHERKRSQSTAAAEGKPYAQPEPMQPAGTYFDLLVGRQAGTAETSTAAGISERSALPAAAHAAAARDVAVVAGPAEQVPPASLQQPSKVQQSKPRGKLGLFSCFTPPH